MRTFDGRARLVIVSLLVAIGACRQDDNTLAGPKRPAPKAQRDVVPDEAPDEALTLTTLVTNPSKIAGSFIQDVIEVRFAAGAPPADRLAAVNAVGGTVVGGLPFGDGVEGIYYIQLPADSTNERIFAAIDTLTQYPQVVTASPEMRGNVVPLYLKPDFGTGMRPSDWHLSPDSAFGHSTRRNWALDAINAPNAWGCATGSFTTKVAVIDMGLHRTGLVAPNVVDTSRLFSYSFAHGGWVSSIIGAHGDSASQMSGVAWNVGLLLYGVEHTISPGVPQMSGSLPIFDLSVFQAQIKNAVKHGARVINVSLGSNIPHSSNTHTAEVDRTRAMYGHLVRQAIRDASATSGNPHPLIVLGAGNFGTDSYWNAVLGIRDSLSTESIVVAGFDGTVSHAIDALSDFGGSVSIAAPGVNVAVSDGDSLIVRDGTSASGAFVSGTAALLFSFDPSLSAVQVKQYIENGAIKGGRHAAYSGVSVPEILATSFPEILAT